MSKIELSYGNMAKLFRAVENESNKQIHIDGCIVFTEDSFEQQYTLEARTYRVSSNNKAFQPNMGGYSIYGGSVDGTDPCVRLERYMAAEHGGKNGWKIERCYINTEDLSPVALAILSRLSLEWRNLV
jgi:hypothetical protein